MQHPDAPEPLPAATVDQLMRLAGLPPADADTLARVAVGSAKALATVEAAGGAGFDDAPDAFLVELDRLAADDD